MLIYISLMKNTSVEIFKTQCTAVMSFVWNREGYIYVRLRKNDRVLENGVEEQQQCRAPGSDLERRHEIKGRRSIARRPAQDAEKFLTAAFLLVSLGDKTESKSAPSRANRRRYTRDTRILSLLPGNKRSRIAKVMIF